MSRTIYRQNLLAAIAALWFANVCLAHASHGQAVESSQNEATERWKKSQLAELDIQLTSLAENAVLRDELNARRAWLEHWMPDRMVAKPVRGSQFPKLRIEPILESESAAKLRKTLMAGNTERDKSNLLILKQAMADFPDDIGLQQLYLHWIDHPIRRKTHLKEIDRTSSRLIESLKAQDPSNPAIRLAIEFTMYRRGRALAYRELPDVVKHTPIENQEQLNIAILSAYEDLNSAADSRRPEFILLEIRILRRAKFYGRSLSLVEQYGEVIPSKWYMKKRRDLLRELDWEIPYNDAAKIYADKFPEEVAKEKRELESAR